MYDRAKSTQSERDRAEARYNRIMSKFKLPKSSGKQSWKKIFDSLFDSLVVLTIITIISIYNL